MSIYLPHHWLQWLQSSGMEFILFLFSCWCSGQLLSLYQCVPFCTYCSVISVFIVVFQRICELCWYTSAVHFCKQHSGADIDDVSYAVISWLHVVVHRQWQWDSDFQIDEVIYFLLTWSGSVWQTIPRNLSLVLVGGDLYHSHMFDIFLISSFGWNVRSVAVGSNFSVSRFCMFLAQLVACPPPQSVV